MKRILPVLVAIVLLCGLTACGTEEPEQPSAEPSADPAPGGQMVGSWQIYEGEAASLPKDVQEAFDEACAAKTDVELVPVALVGNQVVGGMNYKILCRQTAPAEEAGTLKVVEIYDSFEEDAGITMISAFNLTAYTDGTGYKPDPEPIDGGWGSSAGASYAVIPEEAQAAFDKASADLADGAPALEALLATQVVSGTNYMFLCSGDLGGEFPDRYQQVVIVYADLDGNAQITNICTLDSSVL